MIARLFHWLFVRVPQCFPGEFDIEGQPVVSVERKDGATIIGIDRPGSDEFEQWTMAVPLEKHDEMVARLRTKIAKSEVAS